MSTDQDSRKQRFKEIDRLFDLALDLPRGERLGFLELASGGDREIVEQVVDLLRAEEDSQGLFDGPGAQASREFLEDLASRAPRSRTIGRYRLLEELGRGGMGTVYLAEFDGEGFRQQVAVKVLRRGIDTDDVIRRFVTERRILASLSHPNIARLQDGGATRDGRPYLVMELVAGEPIDTFCDRHRLGLRERLELVLEATRAVQAAHNKLVVHRDLKPSNILVTPDAVGRASGKARTRSSNRSPVVGHVKLLDFGIAKLLDPDDGGEATKTGLHLMTPEHASPEQLRGDPVTTATDVYQLGVLLFRLLTGQSPHRSARRAGRTPTARSLEAFDERAPLLDEAPRPSVAIGQATDRESVAAARDSTPSQLQKALAGDLDTLVCKALKREPAHRYSSAEELAGDIQRFLDGRPITARPDTFRYRTAKLLRRHPWLAPVAGAALLLLTGYVMTVARYTSQLQAERNTAQLEAERAREIQGFLIDLFASADPNSPADPELGRRITVVEALDVGTKRLESSLEERPAVRASLLAAISKVYQNLGVVERALPLREEAIALERGLDGPDSRTVRDSIGELALLRGALGELEVARDLFEKRLALARAARPRDAAEVADAQLRMGNFLHRVYQSEEAEAHLDAIIEMTAVDDVPLTIVAEATRSLADVQRRLGRNQESEANARKAVALIDQVHGETSVASALARGSLAQTLGLLGRVEEAETYFAAAIEGLERTVGTDHGDYLTTLSNLAVLRMNSGNHEGAEKLLRRTVELGIRVHGEHHPNVGAYLQNHGTVLAWLGRLEEARTQHERADAIYREVLTTENYSRALPSLSLSGIDLIEGRGEDAERTAREALGILERALPDGHYITAVAECRVARALVLQGRSGEAGPYFERAIPALVTTPYVPDYRSECLEAALDFHRLRGDRAAVSELRAALGAGN